MKSITPQDNFAYQNFQTNPQPMTQRQVATALGIPEGSVHAIEKRALRKIARFLKKRGYSPTLDEQNPKKCSGFKKSNYDLVSSCRPQGEIS